MKTRYRWDRNKHEPEHVNSIPMAIYLWVHRLWSLYEPEVEIDGVECDTGRKLGAEGNGDRRGKRGRGTTKRAI